LEEVGSQVLFFRRLVRSIFRTGFEWNELARQSYNIGVRSLPLVAVAGLVVGLVITIQTDPTMKYFGASSYTPSMIAISVVREIGPVVIALICAGKVSSGIGAELGSMTVTEQIDAMDVSGADPMQYLVATRVLACMLMIPLLTLLGDVIALVGGYIGQNMDRSVSVIYYYQKAFKYLVYSDLIPSVIKTVFFGFAIGFVGCYKGYNAAGGTEGVGTAANSAVVYASFWIIILDAMAAQLTNIFVYQ